jgi:molybdopterin molybdotransferase
MLTVKTLAETKSLINQHFGPLQMGFETISLEDALNRFLALDIISNENIPAFVRSTVDGYAVISRDLVGCSDSIPAILRKAGESLMGEMPAQISKRVNVSTFPPVELYPLAQTRW